MHGENSLNFPNGPSVPDANIFGQKVLREWSRTLEMIKPQRDADRGGPLRELARR